MRIAIKCSSFLKKQYTGIGRYAYHLVKSLSEIDGANNYELYVEKGLFDFKKKAPRFQAKNFVSRVDWFGRGPEKTLKNIDIFHFPSPGPLEVPSRAKVIVTVHDIIFKAFPRGHTQPTIDVGERQFKEIGEKADKIICCSVNTVNDLKKYFQIPDEKIALVYQGVDQNIFHGVKEAEDPFARKVLAARGVESPFLLSVGTLEPRKNLINLIKAFHELTSKKEFSGKLVVIGMKGWLHDDITFLIEKLGLAQSVVFLGYVPDEELRYFYAKAEIFVFPSFYEGFGFPIVEAFSCGVPVVTSNVSSCPEVAADAALKVDPGNFEAIAGAMRQIITDRGLGDTLRKKGFDRARDFDLYRMAHETLKVYQEVHER